jgi:hypothetical protein
MTKLFISHSSLDDAFVRELRWTLADLKQEVWIDSRELRAGDPLLAEIQKAIEDSSAVAVVVSPNSLQAKWVGKELQHALAVQKQRGRENFPVFVLSLDGTKLGVLEELFGHEPVYIPVSSAAGGVEAAMNPILVAMGKRLPAEVAVPPQPTAEPLEELVLELTDLKFHEDNGVRRPSARARLVYEPSTPGQREVASAQSWRLIAPIGPIEAGELRWYLEQYAVWPSHYFRERARKVEENLKKWGQLLHEAALPAAHTANVVSAWSKISDHAGRSFSVHVDAALEAGTPAARPSRSCWACRGNCSTTATVISFKAQSPPASAGACRTPGRSTFPWSRRRSASCSSRRGRRTTRAATLTIAPARCRWSRPWNNSGASSGSTCSARPRLTPRARNSNAPSTPARRITSPTSTATASMTAASASAGCASRIRATRTSSTAAAT